MTIKINGRTPEEIKRKLGCLSIQENGGCEDNYTCHSCNYHNKVYMDDGDCFKATLAYIQQLEAGIDRIYKQMDVFRGLPDKIQQLERERDAAVEAAHGVCKACIHFNGHYPPGDIMSCCKFEECLYGMDEWDAEDHWQWRGVPQVVK